MDSFRDHLQFLKQKATQARIDVLETIHRAEGGHPGSSLSMIDLLVGLYYGKIQGLPIMQYDARKPGSQDQDYFVLSKGHAAPAWYAVLADLGFFDKAELDHFRQANSMLQAHPSKKIPGVPLSAGSLGHGFSSAIGLAMALKAERATNRVFVLLGDGELQEGQIWEAALTAAHYRLDNVVAIIDANGLQLDGTLRSVMNVEPIADKFEAFGWKTIPVRDGHDFEEILAGFEKAFDVQRRPTAIIARTVKGKGVSFMENKASYHGVALSDQEMAEAIPMLKAELAGLRTGAGNGAGVGARAGGGSDAGVRNRTVAGSFGSKIPY